MLLIISLMLSGVFIGFVFVSRDNSGRFLKLFGKIQQIATVMLLFAMGTWLGGNPEFWLNIKTTGIHGLLFAIMTIALSVVAVFIISRFLAKGDRH